MLPPILVTLSTPEGIVGLVLGAGIILDAYTRYRMKHHRAIKKGPRKYSR